MNIKESISSIQSSIKAYYEANTKRVQIIGLAAIAVIGASVYWFQFYMPSQEKEAVGVFSVMPSLSKPAHRFLKKSALNSWLAAL